MKDANANKVEVVLTPEQIAEREKKIAEQKAKKLANDKRLKELHKKEAADRVKKAGEFLKYTKDKGIFDKLPKEYQDFLNAIATPIISRSTVSVFNMLFGDDPKVGTTVTLMEAFQKTMKGKAQIDHFISKKWAPAGIVVDYEANANNLLDSKYILKKLATAPVNED